MEINVYDSFRFASPMIVCKVVNMLFGLVDFIYFCKKYITVSFIIDYI